ncbi:MAG: spore maturation protein CgeB [Spirosomataceae bacterium]|jgi:spore maturation protein CgeB
MNREKKPLFRKVNTRARSVRHDFGGDFKYSRNQKSDSVELIKGSMHSKKARGLDYTPLFRFLLSKVGSDWNEVFSEAKSRLNKTEPIYWIVALNENEKEDYKRIRESSYFSGLYVDKNRKLQLTNPSLQAEDLTPFCDCCTHTLNGKVFGSE